MTTSPDRSAEPTKQQPLARFELSGTAHAALRAVTAAAHFHRQAQQHFQQQALAELAAVGIVCGALCRDHYGTFVITAIDPLNATGLCVFGHDPAAKGGYQSRQVFLDEGLELVTPA